MKPTPRWRGFGFAELVLLKQDSVVIRALSTHGEGSRGDASVSGLPSSVFRLPSTV